MRLSNFLNGDAHQPVYEMWHCGDRRHTIYKGPVYIIMAGDATRFREVADEITRGKKVDAISRRRFGMLVCIGWIMLTTAARIGNPEELTVRSGSKTITITSGAPAGSRRISPSDFAKEMLLAHNEIRDEAGVPPLQWSRDLAAYSEKWAKSLIARNRTAHNTGSPYGENILATGLGSTPSSVVAEWASESRDYSYRTNSCNGDCGRYTQLVWRGTRKVGCAMAHDSRREIWVCSYDPPGNFKGERPY